MLEFDPKQPYYITGAEGFTYYVQNGRKYIPKSKGVPQLRRQLGAQKTEAGGQVYKCLYCLAPFPNPAKMGRHYHESKECGEYVRKRRGEMAYARAIKSNKTTRATRIINKILGVKDDSR